MRPEAQHRCRFGTRRPLLRLLRTPLEQLLQLLLVSRQLPSRLPKDERSKHPGDPVGFQFEGDRYARPLAVIEWCK